MPLLAQQGTTVPATQEQKVQEETSRFGYLAPAQDAYQGAWRVDDAQQGAALWKKLCEARPADVNAQFNWFRSERNARLSANNGQLRSSDRMELNNIADRINATAPSSFEQHLSTYYVKFPDHTAFSALDQAAEADPDRSELILPKLIQANLNGDRSAMDRGCADLETKAALSPALLDVASDLLASVATNSVVFCNGEMDTYPAFVRQRKNTQRLDVLIVDQRLLADANYRQRIWTEAQASGPVPSPGPDYAVAMHKATRRPVALALSLDPDWFDAFPGQLCATGISFEVCNDGRGDVKLLEQRWAMMKKTVAAGPLSRNYLLPGSVLLQRYRAKDDEANTASMEGELRRIADQLGATPELYKAGVLLH